jgi:hypothetical protein
MEAEVLLPGWLTLGNPFGSLCIPHPIGESDFRAGRGQSAEMLFGEGQRPMQDLELGGRQEETPGRLRTKAKWGSGNGFSGTRAQSQ